MFHVKLSPAETHIYTILAERADMTLDEWIQSLPRLELARLELEDPDAYRHEMMTMATRMLDEPAGHPNASASIDKNYKVCPSCNVNKYASAFPGGAEECLLCSGARRKKDPGDDPAAEITDASPAIPAPPHPKSEERQECLRCGVVLPLSRFSKGVPTCEECIEKESNDETR